MTDAAAIARLAKRTEELVQELSGGKYTVRAALHGHLVVLHNTIDALAAERDALQRDAARYRELVDPKNDFNIAVSECMTTNVLWLTGEQLTAALDERLAALARQEAG